MNTKVLLITFLIGFAMMANVNGNPVANPNRIVDALGNGASYLANIVERRIETGGKVMEKILPVGEHFVKAFGG